VFFSCSATARRDRRISLSFVHAQRGTKPANNPYRRIPTGIMPECRRGRCKRPNRDRGMALFNGQCYFCTRPRPSRKSTLGLSIGRCTTPTERGSAGSTQPRFTARLRTRAPRDRRDPDRHTTVKSVGHESRRRRCPFPRRCYHVDRSPVVVLVDESEEVICHTRHRGRAQTHVCGSVHTQTDRIAKKLYQDHPQAQRHAARARESI